VGVNSRLDSIQAAVLKVKLQYLDEYIKARLAAADFYDAAFAKHPKLVTPFRDPKSTHVFHQYTLVTKDLDRDELQKFLTTKNIPAMVYYPVPMHMQKAYQDPRYKEGDFPVTEKLSKSVISLPMHTEMDEEQLKFITSSILEFANR
jgi:dTDP-4-amino-4,6-dideoxygalactose transaminase